MMVQSTQSFSRELIAVSTKAQAVARLTEEIDLLVADAKEAGVTATFTVDNLREFSRTETYYLDCDDDDETETYDVEGLEVEGRIVFATEAPELLGEQAARDMLEADVWTLVYPRADEWGYQFHLSA